MGDDVAERTAPFAEEERARHRRGAPPPMPAVPEEAGTRAREELQRHPPFPFCGSSMECLGERRSGKMRAAPKPVSKATERAVRTYL